MKIIQKVIRKYYSFKIKSLVRQTCCAGKYRNGVLGFETWATKLIEESPWSDFLSKKHILISNISNFEQKIHD